MVLFFFFFTIHSHCLPPALVHLHNFPGFQIVEKTLICFLPPGISRAFDWSLTPYRGDFNPKRGPPSRAFDFCVKTLVSGREQKDFVNLSFSMCSKNGTCLDQNWKKNIKLTKLLLGIFWDLKWEYSCECLRRTWVTVSIQVWLHHPFSYQTNVHGITSQFLPTHIRGPNPNCRWEKEWTSLVPLSQRSGLNSKGSLKYLSKRVVAYNSIEIRVCKKSFIVMRTLKKGF